MPSKKNTAKSKNSSEPKLVAFNERLRDFRESRGLSRADMAMEIGVTPITLYRWENGSSRPSPLAGEKLQILGFGDVQSSETNASSVPKLKMYSANGKARIAADELRINGRLDLDTPLGPINLLPAPFVRNGPPDQAEFYKKLLELQLSSNTIPQQILSRRLALVEDIDDVGSTALHSLEKPRSTALSWSSNYGSHGWHRYVGRFPPQVIRALLNHFGADSKSVVCDPFAGSGTTAVECRLLGIPFVGIEICPLSCMITRTKSAFPSNPKKIIDLSRRFAEFYADKWQKFLGGGDKNKLTHASVMKRDGNKIPSFANIERWFTPEALLGTSIAVEFGLSEKGYLREAVLLALSSKMRSIGNVDVDVVRAEYSKKPRENVDVGRLVTRQLSKMAIDISASLASHSDLVGPESGVKLIESSVLDADLPESSIDYIITSPPYGVEAISYLRTHLLSYRSLVAHLDHDPYDTRDKTIGSEYLTASDENAGHRSLNASPTCRRFFERVKPNGDSKFDSRRAAMMQFCDDMLAVGESMAKWLKNGGKVAFIIGNKRLGEDVMPMDVIVNELFKKCGLDLTQEIRHKLKTNNSNSQVPWQERIIQEESIMLFNRKKRRA